LNSPRKKGEALKGDIMSKTDEQLKKAFDKDANRAERLGADLILLSVSFPLLLAVKEVVDSRFGLYLEGEVRFTKKAEGTVWKRLLRDKGVAMLPNDLQGIVDEYIDQIIRTQMSFNSFKEAVEAKNNASEETGIKAIRSLKK